MCLIIDANVASLVFSPQPDPEFSPVWRALIAKKAVAVHGGHLSREYARIQGIRRLLIELGRQGILRKIADDEVDAQERAYSEKQLQSDDPHILGLAHVSQVRLLCSHDHALHADFTNPKILRPAGHIFQTRAHVHLLRKHCRK